MQPDSTKPDWLYLNGQLVWSESWQVIKDKPIDANAKKNMLEYARKHLEDCAKCKAHDKKNCEICPPHLRTQIPSSYYLLAYRLLNNEHH